MGAEVEVMAAVVAAATNAEATVAAVAAEVDMMTEGKIIGEISFILILGALLIAHTFNIQLIDEVATAVVAAVAMIVVATTEVAMMIGKFGFPTVKHLDGGSNRHLTRFPLTRSGGYGGGRGGEK